MASLMTGDAWASNPGLTEGWAARLPAFAGLVRFGLVGMSGMAVNLLVLTVLLRLISRVPATTAQALAETVATQVAIVWNFALTEAWVFRATRASARRLGRMAGFWSVSMAALAVQLPLSHLLDAALKVGYVGATAAALVILVSARFALCRALLYGGASAAREASLR
jgi:dolichol-phosphate mannosyltransferase